MLCFVRTGELGNRQVAPCALDSSIHAAAQRISGWGDSDAVKWGQESGDDAAHADADRLQPVLVRPAAVEVEAVASSVFDR